MYTNRQNKNVIGVVVIIYFIVNPISGKSKGAKAYDSIKPILKNHCIEFELYETRYKGHAINIAETLSNREDCDLIAVIGGDGTFSEVLNGINLSVPLCLIPAGTGNDFAKSLGISMNPQKAIKPILNNGVIKELDYIAVNNKRCLNVAGTGFDIQLLLNEKKIRKFIKGKSSYYFALLKTILLFKFHNIKLTIDDNIKLDTSILLIAVANGKYIGGGMPISLDSKQDDGFIDLTIIKKIPKLMIPKLLIKFLRGTLKEQTKYVDTYKCKELEFSIYPHTFLNLDGELTDIMPVKMKIAPGSVKLLLSK